MNNNPFSEYCKPLPPIPEGLTFQEEYDFFRKLVAEESAEREIEQIKKAATPQRIREQYPYCEKLGMENKDIPHFMKGFFITPCFSTEEKDKFVNDFCKPYLNDKKYHDDVEGKYLYFQDNIIADIVENPNDTPTFDHYVSKIFIKIGELPQHNLYGKISQELGTREITYTSYDKRCVFPKECIPHSITVTHIKSFKIPCFINADSSIDITTRKEKIIDSGCDISPIFDFNSWYFEEIKFKNSTLQTYEAAKYLELFNTCNGPTYHYIIYLNRPLFISLGKLTPVPITSFLVSTQNDDSMKDLIGMDIISQHSMIFSKFDGIYGMKIMELREEF